MSARPVIRNLAQLDDYGTLSDAAAGTPSLRTLGTAGTQAAAGNHGHVASAITSGVLAMARLATGTPDGTKFVRDDGTLQVPAGGAGGVLLGPDDAADNTIQPTADVPALTLKQSAAGTSARLQEWQRSDASIFASVHPGSGVANNGRFELRNTGTGHGPHTWTHTLATFDSVQDPVMYIGYNLAGGGTPITAGEPYACLAIEGDYAHDGQRDLEWYSEMQNVAGTIQARAFAAVAKRDATTKETFAYNTSILGTNIWFYSPKTGGDTTMLQLAPGAVIAHPLAGANNLLRVKAATSFAAQLALGFGGTDDVSTITTISTAIVDWNITGSTFGMRMFKIGTGVRLSIGVSENANAFTVGETQQTSQPVIVARGLASHTGPLFAAELAPTAGTFPWKVTATAETLGEGFNIVVGTTTGTKIGTGATQKLGFWNATPVAQPSAYTQTYATASRTNANPTATTISNGAGIAGFTSDAERAAVTAAINALIVDVANNKQLINALIDDKQATGLCA